MANDETTSRRRSDDLIIELNTKVDNIEKNLAVLKDDTKSDLAALKKDMDNLRLELLGVIKEGFGGVNNKINDHEQRISKLEEDERVRKALEAQKESMDKNTESWVKPVLTTVLTAIVVGVLVLLWAWLTHFGTMPLQPLPTITP